ncbi:DUF4179 domain-containing protein [Corynebacterium cystitidis]|uniref:DUF4179 domain-containing protein n=1 Tax=Corynebacterium cystitidis TaxID=35757 RepID=UPI00211EC662|nr:DUF4179 domain-containing protein [Corynebacterium cystitidis]
MHKNTLYDEHLSTSLTQELNQVHFTDQEKDQLVAQLGAAPPRRSRLRGGSRTTKGLVAAFVAAGLVVGGGVAYGTGTFESVHNFAAEIFGAGAEQFGTLELIGQPIGASASDNGVTITADAVIGDERNVAIRYTIAKDDGTPFNNLPDAFDDGILPLGFKSHHTHFRPGMNSQSGSISFYDEDPTDNTIQMVEQYRVSGDIDLKAATAVVELQDLWVPFPDDVLITEGSWKLKFKLDYQPISVPLTINQARAQSDPEVTITSATLSPLGVSVDYTDSAPFNRSSLPESGQWPEGLTLPGGLPEAIATLSDGTTHVLEQQGQSCDLDQQPNVCVNSLLYGEIIDPQQVESITIGDARLTR